MTGLDDPRIGDEIRFYLRQWLRHPDRLLGGQIGGSMRRAAARECVRKIEKLRSPPCGEGW